MDPEAWIKAFATELGTEPPTTEQIDHMLKLASVAAHSSERLAAPIACWIAGSVGADLAQAREIAEGIAPQQPPD
jgi:hypothetical protein